MIKNKNKHTEDLMCLSGGILAAKEAFWNYIMEHDVNDEHYGITLDGYITDKFMTKIEQVRVGD